MKKRTLFALSAFALLFAQSSQAQTPGGKYTTITGSGQTLYNIAIAPVIGGGRGGRTATKVMERDLTLCGVFKVLNRKGFLANLRKEGTGIVVKKWTDIGALGVIKARARRSGRGYSIDFFLYDTGKGAEPVLKKTYSGRSPRRLAHQFDNDVYFYFTKSKGIFLTKIAFTLSSRRKKVSNVYVMDYDGHGGGRISYTGNQNILPNWAPGGRLVWTSLLWQNPDLYISGGGRRARRLSRQPGLNSGAAFSPDGSKIAITMSRSGNSDIWLISPSGKILRQLTKHGGIDASPTWSPDGSRIAFVSNRGGSAQIYVMSSSGGGVRRLTFQGNYNQEPDWNPKPGSNLIAFTGRDGKGAYDIFTVDAKKGTIKRLTQGQGSCRSPTWSPNGRLVAYETTRGGIWVMDDEGLNQHQLKRYGTSPAWSR
ncbi:MAG: PD40 domain-containing protein [Myxococcales bacterium]|nr:PD40 domain-containing protein [Myxococcales bacterium]